MLTTAASLMMTNVGIWGRSLLLETDFSCLNVPLFDNDGGYAWLSC